MRWAAFARGMRGHWFDLDDHEMNLLVEACEQHSDGLIDADITVQTCWDADRLDLGIASSSRIAIARSKTTIYEHLTKHPNGHVQNPVYRLLNMLHYEHPI